MADREEMKRIAYDAIDPFLTGRHVVNDGRPQDDVTGMKSSEALAVTYARALKGHSPKDQAFWLIMGETVARESKKGIRCDQCTALVIYTLQQRRFPASLTVIEQGQGNSQGHWFVAVGMPEEFRPVYPNTFGNAFVIDLWGAGVSGLKTSVVDPARCIYRCGKNELNRRASFEGEGLGAGGRAPGKKRCFLTTACMEAKGLPDDCEELQVLRVFRDEYVQATPEGKALVEEYYALAPEIMEKIDERADSHAIYVNLYANISEAVRFVQQGKHQRALAMYQQMVRDLRKRYCR